mmetsp:Transcript_37932/g.84768  ORF Transcript_37932/g.84768 Transcript_37932/m.84768 type:complete len:221 (-) Transcript_37932:115-777(-)
MTCHSRTTPGTPWRTPARRASSAPRPSPTRATRGLSRHPSSPKTRTSASSTRPTRYPPPAPRRVPRPLRASGSRLRLRGRLVCLHGHGARELGEDNGGHAEFRNRSDGRPHHGQRRVRLRRELVSELGLQGQFHPRRGDPRRGRARVLLVPHERRHHRHTRIRDERGRRRFVGDLVEQRGRTGRLMAAGDPEFGKGPVRALPGQDGVELHGRHCPRRREF